MRLLEARPSRFPRSRPCDALGLSRSGTYPRVRQRRVAQPAAQPRALSADERQAIRDLVHREADQDASLPVIHARELNAGPLDRSQNLIAFKLI